ncbi:uncharacterized protein [Venturia canescens]|uniref:uncharacterized protein n=1 Tax=Venturia canescens TaxID=32260 RepID=UPI001C9D3EFE|nr:uncharacterized protein LOC122406796 [Venturia canescens]
MPDFPMSDKRSKIKRYKREEKHIDEYMYWINDNRREEIRLLNLRTRGIVLAENTESTVATTSKRRFVVDPKVNYTSTISSDCSERKERMTARAAVAAAATAEQQMEKCPMNCTIEGTKLHLHSTIFLPLFLRL